MFSPAPHSESSQIWVARAAELKKELMARKHPVNGKTSPVVEIHSQVGSQNLLSFISPSSNATARITTTNLLTPATQAIASAMQENEAQKIQEELKELERIISFSPSEVPLLTNNTAKKLSSHAFQTATNHTPSTLIDKPSKQTEHKEQKDKTDETVLHTVYPKSSARTDANKTVGNPQEAIHGSGSQPLKVELYHDVKDLDKKHVETSQSSLKTSNTKENPTPAAFRGDDVKKTLLPGSPPSMNTMMEGLAFDPPQRRASQPPPATNILQTQQHLVPEKPVSKPSAQDTTPPSAPYKPTLTGRETQHYRPSFIRGPVDQIHHDRRRGGSTRPPRSPVPPRPSLPPPDVPSSSYNNNNYYRPPPRDPDLELEKFASRDRDLQDWLVFTGWHNRGHRADFLQRKRRLAQLDRERQEIEQERAQLMSSANDDGDGTIKTEDYDLYSSRNPSRQLSGLPAPRIRKREYVSDYENESPRKMSRQDNRDDRRDLPARDTGDYSKRGYYHEEVREDVTRPGCELTPPIPHQKYQEPFKATRD